MAFNRITDAYLDPKIVQQTVGQLPGDAGKSYAPRTQLAWTPNISTFAHVGKLNALGRDFDDLKRVEGDNPTLGIILCADKDETLVRYSVLSESLQRVASKYRLVLPNEEELAAELDGRHVFELPAKGDSDE